MVNFLSAVIRLILCNPRSIFFEKYDNKYLTSLFGTYSKLIGIVLKVIQSVIP